MKLSPADLDALRSRVVLSEIVGRSIKLRKAGREWKALCPFHEEKTPSFTVSDEKGFYHCFGCGAHGDAIRWLMEKDRMGFGDAVSFLQKLTGFELKEAAASPSSPAKTVSPKSGGGKLSRSETVTVRLDPKLNYLCELGARAQRRTKSSFIEWAIANSLDDVDVPTLTGWNTQTVNLAHVAERLWQVDEADRVAALALSAPSLLNHEEQLIWRYVKENGFLWRGQYNSKDGRWTWDISETDLIIDRLRKHWDAFRSVALEGESEDILPKWQEFRHSIDDDLPF